MSYGLTFSTATILGTAGGRLPEGMVGVGTFALVLTIYAICAYWMLRPWFMGVFIVQDVVVVRSWVRDYRVPLADIERVSTEPYLGLAAVGEVGWLPFVGPISILRFEEVGERGKSFPSTVGRLRTVLRVARMIRDAHSTSESRSGSVGE
jgi:hypothetical protein